MSAGAHPPPGAFTTAAVAGIRRTVEHLDGDLDRALEELRARADVDHLPAPFVARAALACQAEARRLRFTPYVAVPLEVLETADVLDGPGAGTRIVDAMLAAHALPGPLGPRCPRFGRTRNLALGCFLPADHPGPCPAHAIADLATYSDEVGVTLELEDAGEFERITAYLDPAALEDLTPAEAEEFYASWGVAELLPWARRFAGHQVRS